jgi:hypothetical protein
MKKIILLVSLAVSVIGTSFAQSLVGKWNVDITDLKSSGVTSSTVEYTKSGTFKMTTVYTFDQRGFSIEFTLVMDGKYEVSGKAMCREIKPESIKGSWDIICPSCDKATMQKARAAGASDLDKALNEVVKTAKSEVTSRGMYQQILQLNEDVLVIGEPKLKKPEVCYRDE